MADMRRTKTPAAEQASDVRIGNWDEVTFTYTEEEAVAEANRCLNCRHRPCVSGCPVAVHIPEFISAIAERDFARAYKIIRQTNALPAVCGRVCPQENQCEGKCVRGRNGEPVAIGRLERFAADWAAAHGIDEASEKAEPKGKRVAVVGSGPAGLTCAAELAARGYGVTVFEALHIPGGVLSYGIPEFRLPKTIVRREIENLEKLGVKIETNVVVGRSITVDELFEEGYSAVFIGSGAGLPSFLHIPGENNCGVYSANEYLTRCNLMDAYKEDSSTPIRHSKRVAVVGGGNVAMDSARSAKRLGAEEVRIIYRRSEAELPARAEEVHHAREEGIIFNLLTNPIRINGDEQGNVKSVTCVRMELGEPDESGRRSPQPVEGSEFDIEIDTIIIAVGTTPNPLIRMTTPGLETDRRGCIITKDDGVTTSRPFVYAGGDAVTGAATVILAMGAGRDSAAAIDEALSAK